MYTYMDPYNIYMYIYNDIDTMPWTEVVKKIHCFFLLLVYLVTNQIYSILNDDINQSTRHWSFDYFTFRQFEPLYKKEWFIVVHDL